MASSIDHFLRQTLSVASATFDHVDLRPARMSLYVCVPGARWLLRSPGPYTLRVNDGPSVPIRRGLRENPLRADLEEPVDELIVAPSRRSMLAALGAMYLEHIDWAEGGPSPASVPFGRFLQSPEHKLVAGGSIAHGPRSFIAAMKRALDHSEIDSRIEVVEVNADEFASEVDLILFGEKNFVRAIALSAEEVDFDHGR